jgi:hypothetical protein
MNLYLDKIVSIEESEEYEEVLDISVSHDNLFIANDILTHNCSFNTASPGMEGISESIGLAATCDVICSLWQDDEDKELGVIRMGLIKNRFGPNYGNCAYKIKYETLTLTETNPDYFTADNPEKTVSDAEDALSKLEEKLA